MARVDPAPPRRRPGRRVAQGLADELEVAVIEVPLLFEGNMAAIFDATIAVVADDAVRTERAAARGTGELEGRNSRQLSQDEKAALATFVVRNDGDLEALERQLAELWPELVASRAQRG